ncbi:TldD/PmbA family protein [Rhizobium sp. LjRoot254]|uniref:TldD/PmbA family protein n=1 Tax=Rhizobium sp. LjRoot254 TaxID=3342297 RepID=UPI003ED0E3D6
MQQPIDSQNPLTRAEELVDLAKKAGATDADAVIVRSRSRSVSVRLGKVEGVDASESDDFSLRVFIGSRVASVSANPGFDAQTLVERAVAMAKASPEDPFACLADDADLSKDHPDLGMLDLTEVSSAELTDAALEAEAAALAVPGVTNSAGSGASTSMGGLVLVTSRGFSGSYMATRFGRGVSVIAGEGTTMERDYEGDSRVRYADLDAAAELGRKAAERAVKKLNPRKADTGTGLTVIYDPRVARGLVSHIASAINGAAIVRKTSFLMDMMGKQILRKGLTVTDDPKIFRGSASRPFDGEGVSGEKLLMVEDGVLQTWFLATSQARELGLKTNGRGVRGGTSVSPSSSNMALEPGDIAPEDMIKSVKSGFYVMEMIGHGANLVTGEYSRGAAGFWIENGELTYPVSEVTIAGNMKDMFLSMTPANDIDRTYSTASPTVMIENMTLAGR